MEASRLPDDAYGTDRLAFPASAAVPGTYRETWTEVSLDAVSRNLREFKIRLSGDCKLMAVVKADAYGHGAAQIARTAIRAGADSLAVAYLDEALQLRAAGIDAPILILGYTPPYAIEAAIRGDVAMTVFAEHELVHAADCGRRLGRKAVVHLKIDTGMTRLGVTSSAEASTLLRLAAHSPWLTVEGAFTHFASADQSDETCVRKQFHAFNGMMRVLAGEGLRVPVKHCCNSAAAMRFPDMHLDMVRIGIGMYGILPSAELRSAGFPLVQAMQFKTKISALKRIATGQPVGYGGTFQAAKPSVIATIPVGYADGLPLALSNRGTVLIGGEKAPIVGRICMDQTMVDVTHLPDIRIGNEVVIFGGDSKGWIPIDQAAAARQSTGYETVCSVGKRVPRIYVGGGQTIGIANSLMPGTVCVS